MRFQLRYKDGAYSVSKPGVATCDVVTADEVAEDNRRNAAVAAEKDRRIAALLEKSRRDGAVAMLGWLVVAGPVDKDAKCGWFRSIKEKIESGELCPWELKNG